MSTIPLPGTEQLPGEAEFTDEEADLATTLPEWAAVERHRGAMRATYEVYELIRARIHKPTPLPEDAPSLDPASERAGYADRLQELQQLGAEFRTGAANEEVRLIVLARLAARRRLEQDPDYITYAERAVATTLPAWDVVTRNFTRLDRLYPSSPWPPEEVDAHEALVRAAWLAGRERLRSERAVWSAGREAPRSD